MSTTIGPDRGKRRGPLHDRDSTIPPRAIAPAEAGSGPAQPRCLLRAHRRWTLFSAHAAGGQRQPAGTLPVALPGGKDRRRSPARRVHGRGSKLSGKSYASLLVAFAYRKQLKPDCTCRSAGTQTMSVANDRTLRSGDLVVTQTAVVVFRADRKCRQGPRLRGLSKRKGGCRAASQPARCDDEPIPHCARASPCRAEGEAVGRADAPRSAREALATPIDRGVSSSATARPPHHR